MDTSTNACVCVLITCTFHHIYSVYFYIVCSCGCSGVCYTEYCCVCVHSTNTEPSLTLHNLNIALDTLPDRVWFDFAWRLNVPDSQQNEIRSQYSSDGERKPALLHTYLTSHPAPSWQHVADAVYRYSGGKFHTVLGRVQRMFPTGKKMHYCHIHVHVQAHCNMNTCCYDVYF